MTALSFDTNSPANPDEYRHKTYIAGNHRPWATSLPLTVYTHLRVIKNNHALKLLRPNNFGLT